MNTTERLDEIEFSLASPMRTYKENATEDAPALVNALRAVLDVLDGPHGTRQEVGREAEPGDWIRGNRHMRVAVRRAVDAALGDPS